MSDDTETTFPSTTFAGSFNGCSSISADFSGDLKFKVSDVPNVLRDLHRLGSGPFDLTIVSRQGQLAGDSVDREWSSMALQAEEEAGIEYAATCIGGACPHFAVHGSGDLAGSYVCQLDPDALMVVAHCETRCPLYPQAEMVGNADDDGVDELPIEEEATSETANPCPACDGDGRIPDKTGGGHHGTCKTCGSSGTTYYEVVYSPDTMTVKELAEEFGALVVAAGDVDKMNEADAARYNALSDELTARDRNPQDWRRIAEDGEAS